MILVIVIVSISSSNMPYFQFMIAWKNILKQTSFERFFIEASNFMTLGCWKSRVTLVWLVGDVGEPGQSDTELESSKTWLGSISFIRPRLDSLFLKTRRFFDGSSVPQASRPSTNSSSIGEFSQSSFEKIFRKGVLTRLGNVDSGVLLISPNSLALVGPPDLTFEW